MLSDRYAEKLQVSIQSTARSVEILKQVGLVPVDFHMEQLWEGNGVACLTDEDSGNQL